MYAVAEESEDQCSMGENREQALGFHNKLSLFQIFCIFIIYYVRVAACAERSEKPDDKK